jgi:hypothetical protein
MRYVAIRSEGGLLPYDLLDKIAGEDALGQKAFEFGLPKGRRLNDEISRVWSDAQDLWDIFKRRRETLSNKDPYGTTLTRDRWILPLLSDADMLGYDLKFQPAAIIINRSTYPISHRAGDAENFPPVHIEGFKIDLDRRLNTKLRTSPQAMVQEYLNNSEQVLWGIVTNGTMFRVLRDSSRTSRPQYLEFDLESIIEGNRYNEFALFYRLCHRSRFPLPDQDPSECLLEQYYQQSLDEGARVRERLRDGVEDALKLLGTALMRHPANGALRERAANKDYWPQYHRQLLLLVYRLLFLMVAEERGLIVADGENKELNQKIYDEWYSIARLRDRATQIVEQSPFGDLWQGLQRTFALFEYGLDTNPLGIPPLNGDLFDQKRAIPDLAGTELYNHALLLAVRRLSIFRNEKGGPWIRVNYSHLDIEELGSVYESLLDYQPVIQQADSGLAFELSPGMERKKTGSYYTRPELVHELIESALVPVMQERLAKAEKDTEGKDLMTEQKAKEKALLDMSVCDPACGSGHFLLAAARRLGKELARIRTGEDEPKPGEFHLAVRDVISHCIYGVDLNPLAVDLCKVALWLEGHWAGKPLSFLDHRIRCGNSLIGVLDPNVLEEGVPDDAFTAVTGDDKKVAAFFKKRNKQDQTSRGFAFEPEDHATESAATNRELRDIAEDTAADVRKKAQMYSSWRTGMQHSHDEAVADLWTAQFFLPLTSNSDPAVCTTKDFLEFAVDKRKKPRQVAAAQQIAQRVRFFHWHLEYPEVLLTGGFDVVLGNPPWERMKLQEEEHWADDPYIRSARTKAERANRLSEYRRSTDPAIAVRVRVFEDTKHISEASGKFSRASDRFEFTAVGDLNTYGLFAELATRLIASSGRAGVIVQSGIATDDTYKTFFGNLVSKNRLVSVFDFVNLEGFFPGIHRTHPHFCALTTAGQQFTNPVEFAFFLTRTDHLRDPRRRFALSGADLQLLNPNTHTCPVFRTRADALLTRAIYSRFGILVDERKGSNPWGINFLRMFDMSNDSDLFLMAPKDDAVPLYEAKLVHQFDHRWATYDAEDSRDCTSDEKKNPRKLVTPRYWVPRSEALSRVEGRPNWLVGFRSLTNTTNERTAIFGLIPFCAVGNSFIVLNGWTKGARLACCFLANANSLVLDYVVRQKVGGTNFNFFIVNQLPFLEPEAFTEADVDWIGTRVTRLTCTAVDLERFAAEVGMEGAPVEWNDDERALLRSELDAYYAHLYGLTRDELRYILDPKDVFGEDFPSETFRVLKEREIKECGEYRTQRLVLASYDELGKSDRFRDEVSKRVSAIQLPAKAASSGRD